MTDDKKPDTIPVLWFDAKGCGPDELALELHPFPSELDGRIPAFLTDERVAAIMEQTEQGAMHVRDMCITRSSSSSIAAPSRPPTRIGRGRWRSTAGAKARRLPRAIRDGVRASRPAFATSKRWRASRATCGARRTSPRSTRRSCTCARCSSAAPSAVRRRCAELLVRFRVVARRALIY